MADFSLECCVADKIVDILDEVASPGSDGGSSKSRRAQLKRQPKKKSAGHSHKKLVLRVYGMSSGAIDSAIREIESLCKDANKKKLLKSPPVQEFVSKMTQEQVICYRYLAVEVGVGKHE